MDLDAFVSANKNTWARLTVLANKAVLTPDEARDLIDLYRSTSTHLSMIRTGAPDPQLVKELSALLIRARGKMAGKNRRVLTSIAKFFTTTYPAALYRFRTWWISAGFLSIIFALAVGWWIYAHPELHEQLGSSSSILQYVQGDFEKYYTKDPDADFTMLVWSNNWYVAALTLAYGITVIGAVQILISNMASLAIAGALMTFHGYGTTFWTLILPHGLLELTAIFVSAGTGLGLFWAIIQPGSRTRLESFVRTGHQAIHVLFGLLLTLFISGFTEGFVTASKAPWQVKVGFGVLIWVAFLIYALILGKKKQDLAESSLKLPEQVAVE
ncbi:stage II sporulation protein M [uncultured Actinomyces sp.]|uniref:stage II sporulation protein M n=1 Tax=uncultured Actinomyces sp. TaxID=249061 RepID=UPI00288BDEEB|nr:stage II sporulation protein M [uncultured Actinomyces sp.]